ncbi:MULTISPECIES: Ger(x)C family spore germination protein [Shouchella]|uniref:Spore germination protein n=3 Tax=Bacillaceae TaxID=186817 RepID=A0A060LQT2_9BACI|nr:MULTISPECIES: Ger(x)C family spore germination protein [Bacillaceae]RQW21851.1 Ger(x)C family spore germination protein [Bacillus sp. C1-1]AIC93611.1 spore germination protein [Shouchella lehensis G1]KQL56402.1 hypothetical protein AN965_13865 [Alkalicoccobacillus plakortidis]MBG9782688.1 hypothetical protein [Shouchella lehensis]TES47694.1 Ger(x)C family spore germination protein [Shouchella lehensis]
MKKRSVLSTVFIALLLLSSCTPHMQLNEDIQYLQALAHDLKDNGDVETTGITTIIVPADEKLPESELIKINNPHLAGLFQGLQAETPRLVDTSRTRLHIFSETFAKEEGLFSTLDSIQRNPTIEQNLKLLISRKNASELFDAEFPFQSTAQQHILNLIDKNEIEQLPKTSMHEFLYRYYASGTDPFLPVIDHIGNRVKVIGLAFFKGDQYHTEINLQQSSYFRKLFEKTTQGNAYVPLGEDRGIVYRYLKSKPKWRVNVMEDDRITISVDIKIEGTLRQKKEIGIEEFSTSELEEKSKEHFQEAFEEMISFLQENKVDPIGITEVVRQHVRGIDSEKWKEEEYPFTSIDVDVQFQINNMGAVK